MMKNPVIFGCLTAVYAVSAAATLAYGADPAANFKTKTPIKHLIVIFQENVSFDHYFATYPNATNTDGTTFDAVPILYNVNNLATPRDPSNVFALTGQDLLGTNPNNVSANPSGQAAGLCATATNGTNASNPFRLSYSQAVTNDQGHNYDPEQGAYDGGKMDGFPACVGVAGPPPLPNSPPFNTTGLTMGYYDGNTVTALWNYAQFYAMNDNHYSTVFGPSTPGALNVVAGQTNGVSATLNVFTTTTPTTLMFPTHEAWGDNAKIQKNISVIGDGDPLTDVCSNANIDQVTVASKNIGDLLTAKNITWGAFMGGFNLSIKNPNGTTGCSRLTTGLSGTTADYIPHHAWFQYFVSTRNPNHARPRSNSAIGTGYYAGMVPEPANHNYDIQDFYNLLAGKLPGANLPAVSYLKAPAYQDGHAGYSNPLDEQTFLVNTINALQNSQYWNNTAVVIMYDDSDGWYDHQMPPIVNPSFNNTIISGKRVDILNGGGLCNYSGIGGTGNGNQQGTGPTPNVPLAGTYAARMNGRCGYGTRMPFLLISPFAAQNVIDHTLTDQSSIVRFIEDNWLQGQRLQPGASFDTIAGPIDNMFDFTRNDGGRLILDPTSGAVVP